MVFEFNVVISGLILYGLIGSVVETKDCTSSKQEWMKLRYTALTNFQSVLNTASTASDVCHIPDGSSCCDRDMEREMYVLGHRKLIQQTNSWLHLAQQMENHSTALQYFFRSDLDHAKNRLHQFFSRIYGYNYKLHRSFFFGFFTDLEEYMAGRRGKLGQLVDNFFNQLRDSIVGLIERSGQVNSNPPLFNEASAAGGGGGTASTAIGGVGPSGSHPNSSPGATDEATETRRIRCLSDRVAQVRPFDDVDVRLRARMLEAYPPARMLVNVLLTTSRILAHMTDRIALRSECVTAVTRYHYCAICAGRQLSDVCPDSCNRLLSVCLKADGPNEAQLTFIWPQLIDAIVLATNRLERSFNFPAVNRHLQMEISEAITSLQTRYAETKSKFESECRFGSAGRKVPNLFNPTGPSSVLASSSSSSSSFDNRPRLPNWSLNSRSKRSLSNPNHSLARDRRSVPSSHASPELLDWQTRQQSTSAFGQPDYGTSSGRGWAESSESLDDDSSNVPDRLIRWAGQLKRTYTAVRDLFGQPAGDLCSDQTAATRTTSGPNVNGAHCWNPPDLQSAPDNEITLVLRQLNEAAKRLQEASSSTRDPDTIVLHLQPRPSPRHAIYPKNIQRDSFGSSNDLPDFNPRNQYGNDNNNMPNRWSNTNQPDYNNPANQVLGAGGEGSGVDPTLETTGSGMGPSKGVDNFFEQEPPKQQQQQTQQQRQQQTNNWDKWQTNRSPPNEWESSGTVGEQDGFLDNNAIMTSTTMISQTEPTTITTTTTTTTTSSSSSSSSTSTTTASTTTTTKPPRIEQPRTTMTTTSTTTTTSPVASTSAVMHHTTTNARTRPHIPTRPDSSHRKDMWPPRPDMTSVPARTEAMTTAPPATPDYSPDRMSGRGRFGHQDSYGLLPDDEDKMQPGGRDLSPVPGTDNRWSQNPDPSSQHNWERDSTQSSGLNPPNYGPSQPTDREQDANKNKYDWSQPGSNQPSQGSSQYIYPEGSGQGPQPETHPSRPGDPEGSRDRPSQWSGRFNQNLPQFPDSAGSGTTPSGEWSDHDKNDFIGGSSEWQEQVEGSATVTPEYTPTQSYDETSSRQFETMPPRPPPPPPREHHVPSLVPHPPLPPAEVWIPARLAPGQPAPSILFIREYNIEGPLYEHENLETTTGLSTLIKVQASSLGLMLFFVLFSYHVFV